MKKLHFMWLQGEEHLKKTYPKLYENQFNWIEKHPDFEYFYWDFDSLEQLMRGYPKYFKYWESINQEDTGELHKYCKLMDFSKHFVFHEHGGFNIDRDLVCLRPVDVFIRKKLMFPTIYDFGIINILGFSFPLAIHSFGFMLVILTLSDKEILLIDYYR